MFAPYVVVAGALLFSGLSALVWVTTVCHLDPPEAPPHREVRRSAA